MAGVTPNEGEDFALEKIYETENVVLGLFTNTSGLSETSVWANITQPTAAGGYAEKTLTPADWTVASQNASTAAQDFVATGAAFSAAIYGYYIRTTDVTPRILHFEVNASAPITVADGDTYRVNLSNTLD
ncbi:MAG: hypothetical protein KJO69_10880 [Gammaproteobacteria bacterium]|nr:hypothetical protein [Gammaproteobacteria bacterium]